MTHSELLLLLDSLVLYLSYPKKPQAHIPFTGDTALRNQIACAW